MTNDQSLTNGKTTLQPHPEHKMAVDMLNSIRILGPDRVINEQKTRIARMSQFARIKHILQDYEFSEENGKIERIR